LNQTQIQALQRNLVINELIAGLTTDGAHHKQYHMEQALKLLTDEIEFSDIKGREHWEEGIPN
jgi:hypothetical protein